MSFQMITSHDLRTDLTTIMFVFSTYRCFLKVTKGLIFDNSMFGVNIIILIFDIFLSSENFGDDNKINVDMMIS